MGELCGVTVWGYCMGEVSKLCGGTVWVGGGAVWGSCVGGLCEGARGS